MKSSYTSTSTLSLVLVLSITATNNLAYLLARDALHTLAAAARQAPPGLDNHNASAGTTGSGLLFEDPSRGMMKAANLSSQASSRVRKKTGYCEQGGWRFIVARRCWSEHAAGAVHGRMDESRRYVTHMVSPPGGFGCAIVDGCLWTHCGGIGKIRKMRVGTNSSGQKIR